METNGQKYLVRLDRNGFWWDAHLNFSGPDCSGTDTYLTMEQVNDFRLTFDPIVLIVNHFEPGSRVPYVQIGEPRGMEVSSFLSPHGCFPHGDGAFMHVIPVEPLVSGEVYNLREIYEPPYRLE